MKRNLNEVALFIRPLFGIPKMLCVVVRDYLQEQVEQIDLILKQHQRDREGIERYRQAYTSSGRGSVSGKLQDALYIAYGVELGQDIPIAQLAPVLQLTYTPMPQETLETVSNGLEGENRGVGGETAEHPAETHYGAFSGMPAPVVSQEPLNLNGLKEIAKGMGLRGYSKLKKADLQKALRSRGILC